MKKTELFSQLIPGLGKASSYPKEKIEQIIDETSVQELLQIYDHQVKTGQLKPYLSAEQLDALQTLAHAERSHDLVLQEQAKAAAEKAMFQLKQYESQEPQRRAQLEADRKVFNDAARTLNFGITEANLSVTRNLLGPGFTVYTIQQAIDSNALILSAPTQEELETWERERIEGHNTFLKTCDVETLKRLTRDAGRRVQPRSLDETQRVRAAEQQMNAPAVQYEPLLPTSRFQGELITKQLLWRLDKQHVKTLVMKYGQAQLNNRIINGIPATQ